MPYFRKIPASIDFDTLMTAQKHPVEERMIKTHEKKKSDDVIRIEDHRCADAAKPGHFKLLPLDNHKVTELFVTHDRYRAILRAL